MRVFLSWSGERSQYVAEQFSEWLPVVIQQVDPFMSERGIEAGSRWLRRIDDELEATDFGVLFVTPENQEEPWLVHEAGALGKSVEGSRVVPIAIGMDPSDIDWPLARFQGERLGRDGIWDLLTSINNALGEAQLETQILESSFDAHFPSLEAELEEIPEQPEEDGVPAQGGRWEEKLDEVLELVRSIARDNSTDDLMNKLAELQQNLTYWGSETGTTSSRSSRLREIHRSMKESRYTLRGNPEDIYASFLEEAFPHAITPIASSVEQSRIEQGEEGTREYMLVVEHDANEGELNEIVAEAADAAGVEVLGSGHRPN